MKKQSFDLDTVILGIAAVLLALLVAFPVYSQTPTPTPQVNDKQDAKPESVKGVPDIARGFRSDNRNLPDIGRVGVDMLSQKPMALKDAIVKGLENNIDIEVSRQDVKIAEFDLKAADGAFEPRFDGDVFYERTTTPNISIFSANTETTNGTVAGNLRYDAFIRDSGANYFVEFSNQNVTTNNQIAILSPQYNTNLTIGLVQPLFRGRGFDDRRRVVEIAKKNLSLTDAEFRQKAIEITSQVQRAYWDLTFALKNLQVQRDGVKDAKDQLEHNKRLVSQGVLAPVDIIAAETQVANLEQQVFAALESANRAENRLKGLISGGRTEAIWTEAIVPTDSVKLSVPKTTLNEALALALTNRPELDSLEVAREINAIDQKYFRDRDKPQIDLTASYSSSGVSGSFNENLRTPFTPTSCQMDPTSSQCAQDLEALNMSIQEAAGAFTGNIGNSVGDVFTNTYPTFRFGVRFSLPLKGNKTAQANLGKALVQQNRIASQRKQLEQIIQIDVRNALQSVRTSEARLRSAAISRQNSERQYESEKRKLDAGLSDIYKVLERQTALMNARSGEIQAQIELNKSIADLQRATGNSLEANDVETKLRK